MRTQRSWLAAAVIILMAALPGLATKSGAAPPPRGKPLATQDILRWINGYRGNPEPQKLPDMVRAMAGLGIFRDLDAAGVYIGFMAGVLGDNPAKAEKLVERMFPIAPEDQVAIVRAIAYSGLPNWKELLETFVERMPARLVLIQRHLSGKAPTLFALELDRSPAGLDTLWGYYFATGRHAPIDRIIGTLAWSRDANDVEKLTLGSMAKWTLANNAQRDKALLDHLKGQLNVQPRVITRELREVIEAAETFETTHLRKAALGAIEELKRKGPESTRNAAWWGQAGQTALALGCVVAGVLGHPEVGIPCVVGGAVSSAVLKLWAPGQ
jgi:hypothetical protein